MPTADSTPDQVADSLEKLTLDSQSKTPTVTEPTKHELYGNNGSLAYRQSYGYAHYGAFTASNSDSSLPATGQDGQLQTLQEYHYPDSYYQLPPQTSDPAAAFASQVEVSTSTADQASLSVETMKGNPTTLGNAGSVSGNNVSRPRPAYQNTSQNQNSYCRRGNFPSRSPSPGFQDPRFSYDGSMMAMPWYDASISSDGSHAAVFSSYSSNSAGGNQNLHLYPQYMNGSSTSGYGQAYGYMNHIYPNSMTYSHYGNAFGANSGLGSFGYSWKKGLGWYPFSINRKPRGRGYGKENMDELNRGPRVKGYRNQNGSEPVTVAVKEHNNPLTKNKETNLSPIPDMELYNKEDFPESYSDARFFVIKSYSEDDVHKSVKYGVWASTSNGNKILDAAYHEAKEKSGGCPVFLLFSVNASGQFVGLAEMVGPVDFDTTVDYWQQDKWMGCFPVKWHIIKDVPNSLLRHITLENNENKPVTNSRDTHEVNLEQGLQILKIFKSHSSKTCILDDFEFYESRQKVMQEKKAKHQSLKKQVSEQSSIDVVTDNSEKAVIEKDVPEKFTNAALTTVSTTAEAERVNGEATPLIADAEDAPAEAVSVASAC